MRTRFLPILLFIVLIIITGCKKNTVKTSTPQPAPQCNGPELLAENVLTDYLRNTDGSISNDDAIATDVYGNAYVENSTQRYSSPPTTNGISGILTGYLYKFDASGKQVFSKPVTTSYGSGIAVDSMQNVYVGYMTILLLPYHCIVNTVKYNTTGDSVWSKHIYYDSDALFSCLGVSNNGILHVAANDWSSPVDSLYNDPTVQAEPGTGNMLYTFDQSGNLTQVKQISIFINESYQFLPSGEFYDISYSNTTGNTANVNKYDVTSKLINAYHIPVPTYSSIFLDNKSNFYNIDSASITKFNSGFTQDWSIKTQNYKLIRSDADGNIYIAGTFNGTVNFNPGGTAKTLTAHGTNDSFIEKFDANGKIIWVIQSLGTDGKTYTGASQINSFLVTSKNEIFVTGSAFSPKSNANAHFAALYTQCN